MANRIPVTVELDGVDPMVVQVDQRDFARAEDAGISPDHKSTWVRHLAWTAMGRSGKYTGSWADFNGRDCVEAIDSFPAEDADSLDPGRSARTAGA